MNLTVKSFFIALCSLSFIGCQTLQQQTLPEQADHFFLQGKLGVRTPEQSGSAFYTWLQQQEQYEIELTGILGIGRTQIQGNANGVTLTNAQVGTLSASTPEELLVQATGWNAPISHLKSWVQAKSATKEAKILYDTEQRPIQINEQNWAVELEYTQKKHLPHRLILTQNTEKGENRITLIIQNR